MVYSSAYFDVPAICCVVAFQQPDHCRNYGQTDQNSRCTVGPAPADQGKCVNCDDWQNRFTDRKTQRGKRNGSAAFTIKIPHHTGDRDVRDQALASVSQQKDGENKGHRAGRGRNIGTGADQQKAGCEGIPAQYKTVDQPTCPGQQGRTANRADHVDHTPQGVAEPELELNMRADNADKVGLSETRIQCCHETEAEQSSVGTEQFSVGV